MPECRLDPILAGEGAVREHCSIVRLCRPDVGDPTRYNCTATDSVSKPAPRLAMEAGNDLADGVIFQLDCTWAPPPALPRAYGNSQT
jgi:hypothetical protein